MIRLVLPWPPSVNHYWRRVVIGRSVRTLISKRGREYRTEVWVAARSSRYAAVEPGQRLKVTIHAYPPDRRKRDLDNLLKAPLDALQHAGVIADDSLIDDLLIVRKDRVAGGKLVVEIEEI